MAETILVTGATGTVGGEVVKQLSAKGKTIKVAARSANEDTFGNLSGVQVVQLDYNKPDTLAARFQRCRKTFLTYPVSI